MDRMTDLTNDERILIGQLHNAGKGPIEISKAIGERRIQMVDYYLLTDIIDELRKYKTLKEEGAEK